jgi:hypothetical protein
VSEVENLCKNGVDWQNLGTSTPRETPMNPQELFCPNMDCPAKEDKSEKETTTFTARKPRKVFVKFVDRHLQRVAAQSSR